MQSVLQNQRITKRMITADIAPYISTDSPFFHSSYIASICRTAQPHCRRQTVPRKDLTPAEYCVSHASADTFPILLTHFHISISCPPTLIHTPDDSSAAAPHNIMTAIRAALPEPVVILVTKTRLLSFYKDKSKGYKYDR